ncbi:unnamed protein product [Cuscuta epithymum]|uniref:Smr domain-containing protein n=1 Tax=Cuscuta epithymum TaxID=186058 RepID=A0AAV0D920_9ASTE|nr:unnamed protein product [Cuscuta epithymum]CAH9144075.1 unnamed protein product [Cuscuta epithymum]
MLRAKQLGTLSHSARSIIFGGSRCNAADSSCTCAEDETCISKRPQTRNVPAHPQTPSTLILSRHVEDATNKNNNLDQKVSRPQVIPPATNPTVVGADRVCYGGSLEESDITYSLSPKSDQFVRVGIAAVNFLSDLVNYKIPIKDGNGLLDSSLTSYVVEHTKPACSVKPAATKTFTREQGKSSVEPSASKSVITSRRGEGEGIKSNRGGKHGPVKVVPSLCGEGLRNFVQSAEVEGHKSTSSLTVNVPANSHYIKRTGAQESRPCPNGHMKDKKHKDDEAEGLTAPPLRKTRGAHTGVFPTARKFPGSGNLVETVSHILQHMNWGSETEEFLRKLDCSLNVYQANQILKKLQDHSVALEFFHWLTQQHGFKHDGHTYTTMVGILGRARQFGAINKLLQQMVNDGCQPNVVTYNRIIHGYGRANYLGEALAVFDQMQKAGCEPDRVTYCTLIDIHAKAGYLGVAMDLYQRMQTVGLSPDTFTYSVIINCLGKAGHLADAHKLFCEMVNHGCMPNLVTYNVMIALHAKARNYTTALNIYRDMQNAGFEPDKVTYSTVMEVLGHFGHLEEVEAVFSEMKRKNWVPDEYNYGIMVDLWGKAGNLEKAMEWYQAMLDSGLCPNVPTCNSLLSAFLRVHRLSDAYYLLQTMLGLGLAPSLQTYTLLLSCCTDEAHASLDMGFCYELMGITGHPAHKFLVTMPSAGADGRNVRDHVTRFLDLMHSEDRDSKRGLVDSVIDFLHKSGLKEEAASVWEAAAVKNIYPDAVREKGALYWLINLHVMSDGTAVTALSRTLALFRRHMLSSGVCPNRIDIVTGWGRRSRVTGTSLVRQTVQDLLSLLNFPFLPGNGNSGCFVGCGQPLGNWLVQPYVERMHLL